MSDIYWGRLHWTKWGSSGAAGYGVEVHELAVCSGQPVQCRDGLNPIWVHLSDPIQCSNGKQMYSRIDVVELSAAKRITGRTHWPYTCHPSEPNIGDGGGGG